VIILFGSFAEDVQHARSDKDIGILYDKRFNNFDKLFSQHKKVRKLLEYEYFIEQAVD
jgi:predicted nucleotidyltransferase